MSSSPGWSTGPPPPPPPGGSGGSGGTGGAPLRPLNVGDVLDGMFRLFLRHWRAYVGAVATIIVPTQLVLAYVQRELVSEVGFIEIMSDPGAAEAVAGGGPGIGDLGSSVVVSILVALLVSPLVTGVACDLGARAHLGQEVGAGLSLRAGMRRYGTLIGANLLATVAFVVTAAVFLLPAAGVAAGGGPLPLVLAVSVPLAFLSLAGVVAVYTLLLLAPVAVMVERRGPLSALRRSWALVRSRFWGVLGIGLLAWMISGVIGVVLSWPFALPAGLFGGAAFLTLTTIGAIVAGVLSAPLLPNALALLYIDTRVRTEGLDIESMAAAVEDRGQTGGSAGGVQRYPNHPGGAGQADWPGQGGRPG